MPKTLYLTLELPLPDGVAPVRIATLIQERVDGLAFRGDDEPLRVSITRMEAFEQATPENPLAEVQKMFKQMGLGKREKWQEPDDTEGGDGS